MLLIFCARAIDLCDAIDSDAEFALGLTGADIFVRVCRDVRVHPYGNRRPLIQGFGDLVNRAQFLFRFDIETEYLAAQSVLDLFAAFADTRKGTLCRIASGFDDPIKFASGNNVKPSALIGEETNDGEVRICFDRVADLVMELVQCLIEPLVVIYDGLRTVDVEGRAKPFGGLVERIRFAGEFASLIVK